MTTTLTLLPGVVTPAEEELAVIWMEETEFQAHRAYVEAHLVPDLMAEATFITTAKFVNAVVDLDRYYTPLP